MISLKTAFEIRRKRLAHEKLTDDLVLSLTEIRLQSEGYVLVNVEQGLGVVQVNQPLYGSLKVMRT